MTAVFIPALLTAQSTFSIDLGASNVSYTGGAQSIATSVSPFFSAFGPQASVTGVANYSRFNTGGWSMQGALNASAISSATSRIRVEGLGAFSGASYSAGSASNSATGRARVHLVSPTRGMWVGAGAGRSNDGELNHDLLIGDIAGWVQTGPTLLQISLAPTRLRNEVTYTDAEATISRFSPRADMFASVGTRILTGGTSSWASTGITYRVLSWLGVVASAGNYVPDYTQGIPGGRYISAALRFSPGTSRASYDPSLGEMPEPSRTPGSESEIIPEPDERFSSFAVGPVSASGNLREIRIRTPDASSVEIMGDFTDWEPVQMRNAGDNRWTSTVKLPPGIYHMNVRANSAAWEVPAGMTTIKDEFGGTVGLLVID